MCELRYLTLSAKLLLVLTKLLIFHTLVSESNYYDRRGFR